MTRLLMIMEPINTKKQSIQQLGHSGLGKVQLYTITTFRKISPTYQNFSQPVRTIETSLVGTYVGGVSNCLTVSQLISSDPDVCTRVWFVQHSAGTRVVVENVVGHISGGIFGGQECHNWWC